MTQRSDWTFEYGIEDVKNAAEKKSQFHSDRHSWWEEERDRVVADIRESGIEVREYEITGGKDAQVVVDPTFAERLSKCQRKITEHQSKTYEYEGWAQVLHSRVMQNDQRTLHLDHQDILYFGLHKMEDGDGTGPDPE